MTVEVLDRPATAALILMTSDEARSTVAQIQSHLDGARRLLLELHEREGWRALGYDSWRVCVASEFGQSQSYLYRQLAAAEVERDLDSPIGEIRESVLRPLAQLDTPQERREVWQTAQASSPSGKVTAAIVNEALAQTRAWRCVTCGDSKGQTFKYSTFEGSTECYVCQASRKNQDALKQAQELPENYYERFWQAKNIGFNQLEKTTTGYVLTRNRPRFCAGLGNWEEVGIFLDVAEQLHNRGIVVIDWHYPHNTHGIVNASLDLDNGNGKRYRISWEELRASLNAPAPAPIESPLVSPASAMAAPIASASDEIPQDEKPQTTPPIETHTVLIDAAQIARCVNRGDMQQALIYARRCVQVLEALYEV